MARRIIAALLIIVASLLAPFAVGALWAERTITEPEAFNETLAPLADDPLVRQTVSTEVSAAIVDAIDAEARAESFLGGLSGPLAELRGETSVDSVIAAAIASGVNNAITSGVDSYVESDQFGQGWQAVTALLQEQFVALIDRDTVDAAVTLQDGQIVLDTAVVVEKIQAQLAERGVPFAGTLDVPGRQVVLADAPNLQLVANALSVFLPVATWLWLVVVIMFVVGVLLWRPRSRGLLWTGLGLAIGALVTYVALDLGSAQLVNAAPAGYSALFSAVSTTLLRFLVNALLVMLTLGVVLALAGWLAGATPVRPSDPPGHRRCGTPLGQPAGRQWAGQVHLRAPDVRPHPARPGAGHRCCIPAPGRPAEPDRDRLDCCGRDGRPAAHRGRGRRRTGARVRACWSPGRVGDLPRRLTDQSPPCHPAEDAGPCSVLGSGAFPAR